MSMRNKCIAEDCLIHDEWKINLFTRSVHSPSSCKHLTYQVEPWRRGSAISYPQNNWCQFILVATASFASTMAEEELIWALQYFMSSVISSLQHWPMLFLLPIFCLFWCRLKCNKSEVTSGWLILKPLIIFFSLIYCQQQLCCLYPCKYWVADLNPYMLRLTKHNYRLNSSGRLNLYW